MITDGSYKIFKKAPTFSDKILKESQKLNCLKIHFYIGGIHYV